ncbi:IS5 family transposase [Xylanimonas allomyrinae]|uniref:IS5 family transposase n=1 Tax=Xylanimonas allomyrinae TaxID=2509459 RepID=UPI001B87BBEA|nr:IS5 family transposase [Xylanimonas allomyrinae]
MLEPLLPVKARGRKAGLLRRQIDGIRFRLRTGCPWRDVPEDRYGPWHSVYRRFRDWQRDGTWVKVIDRLRTISDGAGLIGWDLNLDSTIARVHQHAAGARKRPDLLVEPPGDEPADHGLGHSRGGWTTKIHAVCEQGQKLMGMVVTAGHRGDSPQFEPVLDTVKVHRPGGVRRPRTRPHRVRADRAYSSAANRALLRRRHIRATIPDKIDQQANRKKKGSAGGRPPKVDSATTSCGPRSSACSTDSSGGGPWPRGSTSSSCATRPP